MFVSGPVLLSPKHDQHRRGREGEDGGGGGGFKQIAQKDELAI